MQNDNKVIAQYLYDLAIESKSEFIEIAKDSELINVAKKMNLVIPSLDIAILKTVYAQVDVPNKNQIVISKKATEKALPTLIGKQANWSHKGTNFICGWILDAQLEKDLIVIYVAIFKSIWQEEFETVKAMFKNNKLSCSFEIWNKAEDGSSVMHDLGNGIRSIDPILFHGVGILIGEDEKPACPKAYAQKMIAIFNNKIIQEAEKITDKVFNQDLIYAQLAIEESKCVNCGKCNCKEEDNKVEEIVKVEVISSEETKTEETSTETKTEETKVEAEAKVEEPKVEAEAEVAPVAETKVEEPRVAETPEVVAEVKKEDVKAQEVETIVPKVVVKVTRIYSEVNIDTYVDGTSSGTSETKGYTKNITEYADGTKDETESEITIERKYNFAEVEAEVAKAKAELANQITAKDDEIKNLTEAKDKEIANLKQELVAKAQEIAELTPIVEVKEEIKIEVGSVNVRDRLFAIRAQVDEVAFPEEDK